MLDSIISAISSQATTALTGETSLDAGQAAAALPLAQDSVKEGLMGAATSGNFGGITDLLKTAAGGGGGVAGLAQNAVYGSIATTFIGKLTSSLGIGGGVAQKVATVALPMILGKLGSQATANGGGLDLGAIASMVGGGATGGASDLLGKAGGMLGSLTGK